MGAERTFPESTKEKHNRTSFPGYPCQMSPLSGHAILCKQGRWGRGAVPPVRYWCKEKRQSGSKDVKGKEKRRGAGEEKLMQKGNEETGGGDSPTMQHPREGLPSPKLCLSITPKPAAAQGALGTACRTAAARG